MALYKPSAWIRLCVWPACSCCAAPASIFIHVSKLYSALLNVLRRYRPCRYIVRQQQQHGRQCARTVATATAQTRHSNYHCTRIHFLLDSSSLNRSDIFSCFVLFCFFIRPSRHQDPRKQENKNKRESCHHRDDVHVSRVVCIWYLGKRTQNNNKLILILS